MTQSFQGTQVLHYNVVQCAQFLPISIFQAECIKNLTNMRLVDQSGSITLQFQALDCLLVMLTGLGETLYDALGGTILEWILKLLSIRESRPTVH